MTEQTRLFFALWPNKALATELHSLAQITAMSLPERVIASRLMHLTLRYIGRVNSETKACLIEMAQAIVVRQFEMTLQKPGYWKTPRVIWLAPEQSPDELTQLVLKLEQGCQQCGIKAEPRVFSPHVSLIRKVSEVRKNRNWPKQIALLWRATEFALVESKSSETGVDYQVLNRWQLT